MMSRILQSDFLKLKRKGIWFLVILGPVGVISLQAVNYGLRYDYLVNGNSDVWAGLLSQIRGFVAITLLLGIAILASLTANLEHQTNAWKQILTLPISRWSVFTAKFTLNAFMLLISCVLLMLGTIILGLILGFGTAFPTLDILKVSFYPFFAALPILALQLWLSVTLTNQGIPLAIGVFGAIFSAYSFTLPDWLIWKWPLLQNDLGGPIWNVVLGIVVGVLVYSISVLDFMRRDVK
jgi:lantibiotic transport system permease protein